MEAFHHCINSDGIGGSTIHNRILKDSGLTPNFRALNHIQKLQRFHSRTFSTERHQTSFQSQIDQTSCANLIRINICRITSPKNVFQSSDLESIKIRLMVDIVNTHSTQERLFQSFLFVFIIFRFRIFFIRIIR